MENVTHKHTTLSSFTWLITLLAALSMVPAFAACGGDDHSAEEAPAGESSVGGELEDAAEESGDAAEEGWEDTEEGVGEGTEETGEAIEDTGEDM